MMCTNLADAIYLANATIGMTYWMGVECYLRGNIATGNVNAVNGYNAAKAAFDREQSPEIVVAESETPIVTEGIVALPWEQYERLRIDAAAFHTSLTGDLLELQRKAAAWDSLLETIENLKIGVKA